MCPAICEGLQNYTLGGLLTTLHLLHYCMILPYVRHVLHTSNTSENTTYAAYMHYFMIMPYIRHNSLALLHSATDMSCNLWRITELHTCRTSYNTPYTSLLPDSPGRLACCTLPRHLRACPMLHYCMIVLYIHHNSCTLNLTLLPNVQRYQPTCFPKFLQLFRGAGDYSQCRILWWEGTCTLHPHARHP